jgi:hypothetical protein
MLDSTTVMPEQFMISAIAEIMNCFESRLAWPPSGGHGLACFPYVLEGLRLTEQLVHVAPEG